MTPPRIPVTPVELLRAAVRRAAEASSYRRVAREAGLSPRALQMFVDAESLPRAKTLHRIRDWYVRRAAATEASEDSAAAALALLLHEVAGEPARAQAMDEALDFFERLYAREKVPPPAWIERLRRRRPPAQTRAASPDPPRES